MKNNSLNEIVKCNIDISSPSSNDESFDSILLVVPAPVGECKMEKTTAISKADDLLAYGFAVDDVAYVAATVALSQNPAPKEVYICVKGEEESIAVALGRANDEAHFYGVHITSHKESEDVVAAITWAEGNKKLFGFEYTDISKCPISTFSYYRSFGIFSGLADGHAADKPPEANAYAALAWMAKCFGYEPGTETWHLKELASITPSSLTTEHKKELENNCINTFLRYAGSNVTVNGKVLAGEWIDVIRFRDWLETEMQTRVFNVVKANKKVPFTDAGISLVEGAMESTLKKGQDIGGIAPTEYDDNDNEIRGFEVHVPRIADFTQEERKSRKLSGCHWTARLAGAIHLVEIEGYLTF